ncbi:hypothetical protein [Mycetocola sp. 2940]|uniref:hypothetical protein n=1 Tax=Mycetocola sp. 2940 TaxID=3156452 RepID=UPI003397067C
MIAWATLGLLSLVAAIIALIISDDAFGRVALPIFFVAMVGLCSSRVVSLIRASKKVAD